MMPSQIESISNTDDMLRSQIIYLPFPPTHPRWSKSGICKLKNLELILNLKPLLIHFDTHDATYILIIYYFELNCKNTMFIDKVRVL